MTHYKETRVKKKMKLFQPREICSF